MACNQDSGCYNIATVKYPTKKAKLDQELNKVIQDLDSILTEINSIADIVPDDYVGKKVTEKITKGLLVDIAAVQNDVTSEKTKIDSFIDRKIDEHLGHYRDWQARQQASEEEKEEGDGDTNE